MSFYRHLQFVLIVVMADLCLAGCGQEPTVRGKIEIDSKLMGDGEISFHYANGRKVVVKIKNGRFPSTHAFTGRAKIVVIGDGVPVEYHSIESTSLRADIKRSVNEFNLNLY